MNLNKSDECKVTVIIPTYNSEAYLPELITVLQNQTLKDIQIIFVDDGSTDSSGTIIQTAGEADKRISYYYQENSGAGVARNTGLKYAKGEYVIWIDSDDLYDANFLEELYMAGQYSGADATMCLFRRHDYWRNLQTNDEGYKKDILPVNRVFNGKEVPNFCNSFNPGPINKMYRRAFVEDNNLRYASTRIANDVQFGYSAMILADKIFCIPHNLLTVRRYVNPNSISATRKEHLTDSIRAVDGLWDWAKEKQLLEKGYKEQFLKIFVSAAAYNSQYGATEEFWNECVSFINKIMYKFFALETIQKAFNINTQRLEMAISEQRNNGMSDKEIEMLKNKISFVKRMKNYLLSLEKPKESIIEDFTSSSDHLPPQEIPKIETDSATHKSNLLLRLKLLLAKIWPVTLRRFNLSKADDRKFYLQQTKELKKIIAKQDAQIKNTQKMIQTMYEYMCKNQEKTALILNTIAGKSYIYNTISDDISILLNDVKSTVLAADSTIQKNKEITEINNKHIREILYAEIFNSTTQKSDWFQDKILSPGHWAVGYQYLYPMYRTLNQTKPKRILEFGLGQSTKMISQYAQYYDAEHIIIEHDEKWAEFFQNDFPMPENSKVEICELTFVPYKKAESVRVYKDIKDKVGGKKFDIVSIDAPMGSDMTQYARIDILEILPDCLSENFVILFDDCNRSGEQNTLHEIEKCLKENKIAYKKGIYRGIKDTVLICAEHLRFLTTM